MDIAADFESFQLQVTTALLDTTRTAGQIANEDLNFHRSVNGNISKSLDVQNARLLQLTNKLLKAATADTNLSVPRIRSQDGIDDNWRGIVDVIDDLLEKADASLDEFSGIIQRLSPTQDGAATPPVQREKPKTSHNFHNPLLRKPQLDFHRQVNNYDTTPFKPLLQRKPHAVVPLEQCIGTAEAGKYAHPYGPEIQQCSYPPATHKVTPPIPFQPSDATQAVFVDTGEALQEMLSELKHAKEIAIDLEHHDKHSYVGLVCLMQISTREKDWIVDTLRPWREELQILNHVFADPKILKVFHGATMDMIWLQRDLGLYVVGLFDTYHACVALNLPKRSLSYLLERFANFQAQKQYQLADWRVRPLNPELFAYARSDTHYLLHVYDVLRNMLLEASTVNDNLIDYVCEASKREALQTYERPVYDEENGLGPVGWFKPLTQRSVRFDNQQLAVYRAVHKWRDDKARVLDEGEQYLLPAAALWNLAESMPLSIPDLHNTLRPMPKLVREHTSELIQIIKQAKINGLGGLTFREVAQRNEDKFGVSPWKRRFRPASPIGISGVGATLTMLKSSSAPAAKPDIETPSNGTLEDGRILNSHLWGPMQLYSAPSMPPSMSTMGMALRSVLPLPSLSASFASRTPTQSNGHSQVVQLEARVPKPETNRPSVQQSEVFVIRDEQRSKKRKASPEMSDLLTLTTQSSPYTSDRFFPTSDLPNPLPVPNHEMKATREQSQWKAEEDRAGAAKPAQAHEGTTERKTKSEAEAPFDYANASSLLHTGASANDALTNGKSMNPYLKALDTSTGAKRSKQSKEQAGRSMTFKS